VIFLENFYAAVLIIGLLLILTAIVLILIDKKNYKKDIKFITEKETALREIVADAEYLIEELGKLCDSIADQINNKKEELDIYMDNISRQLELKLNQIEKKTAGTVRLRKKPEVKHYIINAAAGEDKENDINDIIEREKNKQKRIKINDKYKKVVELLNSGMDEAEIACTLNISRGEVQMISRFIEKIEA